MDGMKRVARLCNKGNKKQSKRILIGLIILSVFWNYGCCISGKFCDNKAGRIL